jgi:hypothetical protein
MNIQVQGWQDLQIAQPLDPRTVILNTQLSATQGVFTRATNVLSNNWGVNPIVFTGNNTRVSSLDFTDASTQVDAAQWTVAHQMVNVANNIPTGLSNVAFGRAGKNLDNQYEINIGASTYNNGYLGMMDNLGTSGMFLNGATGGIPVYAFGSGLTGTQILHLTFAQTGTYGLVLSMTLSGVFYAFGIQMIVLP